MWCDAQSKQNVRAQNTGPYRGRQNSKNWFLFCDLLFIMILKKLLFTNNKKVKKWYERKLLNFISQLSYTWHALELDILKTIYLSMYLCT